MSVVCYIPMLEGQSEEVQHWLEGVREKWGVIPVMLPQVDWNDDLTPWPADPKVKKGNPCGGKSEDYLARLETEIIPSIERKMGIVPDERWLLGVSLAGLFAVWASARSGLFSRIASISGSSWYPVFVEWLENQSFPIKSAYLSLGDKETEGKNKHLKSIAEDTASVARILESKGVATTFEWTEGTHFGPLIPRLDMALSQLVQQL